MPLGDTAILLLIAVFKLNPTREFCHGIMTTSTWTHVFGQIFCEVILALRVWAISRTSPQKFKYSIILPALFLVTHAPFIVVTGLFSKIHDPTMDINSVLIPASEPSFYQQVEKLRPINCVLLSNEEHISPILPCLSIIYQIGIVALTLAPGVHAYKDRKFSSMFKAVYRNGKCAY
ncbi:hypothetical protein K435DRAFT_248319 [Dendrothele bispora CBS 962.96]|uniref:Uncharacterized protein n=1 Tax=Dendrothele bispora (strain CBS 962.96) TaxID=1314807 RepID=A0A4S8MLT2_DENBC|nr:hypothetical protein K435DRAFT_248319 [Dendrothele bispora CBS 962.96]